MEEYTGGFEKLLIKMRPSREWRSNYCEVHGLPWSKVYQYSWTL